MQTLRSQPGIFGSAQRRCLWLLVGTIVLLWIVPTSALARRSAARTLASEHLVAIASGDEFTCVLTGAGGMLCWGSNHTGQLGNGATELFLTTPTKVLGLDHGVIAIAAGHRHVCALVQDGGMRCWGYNGGGQLGDGTTELRTTPVAVQGLPGPAAAIASGDGHTCAALRSGAVWCWGDNSHRQLGDGTSTTRLTPVAVQGLPDHVTALAAGIQETCALTAEGKIVCWGADKPPAVRMEGGARAIVGTNFHFCAITTDGRALCWGLNWAGQLGNGTTDSSEAPVAVQGLPAGAVAIAAEANRTFAVLLDGRLYWWGSNGGLQADGTNADRTSPFAQSDLPDSATAVAAGEEHACVLLRDGGAACWGQNYTGQLGNGTNADSERPVLVGGFAAAPPRASVNAFRRLWDQQDRPVTEGRSGRSWTWGPAVVGGDLANAIVREPFADLPGGTREVAYFEKSRMEINDPSANPDGQWYVTNGLLPIELITGRVQIGYKQFEERASARIAAIGDPGGGPTYADLGVVYQNPGKVNPSDLGRPATGLLKPDGTITAFNDYASDPATTLLRGQNNHGVAKAFIDFMDQEGPLYERGAYVQGQVYNPLFVFGMPVTGAYWVKAKVGGVERPILFQVFERRVLTYNPANEPAFRVEMGNVGQHYYRWRYGK